MTIRMKGEKEQFQLLYAVDRFFGTDGGMLFVNQEVCKEDGTTMVKQVLDPRPSLYEEFGRLGVILCGGAVTSTFSNSPINDLDFYMEDTNAMQEVRALIESYDFKAVNKSQNAYTFVRKSHNSNRKWRVQLITRFSGSPEEIFDWFDFTVTHGAYRFDTKEFVLGDRFLPDLSKRVLNYSGSSKYPICAMYRTKKYVERGFKLPGATIMHIALAIVQLKIESYAELKAQLMGIDTMYLQKLLEAKDPNAPVDYGEFVYEAFKLIDSMGQTLAEHEDDECL